MATDLEPYTTEEGETWAMIAHKKYADDGKTEPIINANPGVPVTPRLPGGITLFIPVLTADEADEINQESLPPWRD